MRRARPAAALAAALLPLLAGCATLRETDPFEPVNRKTFAFNETLDRWILGPVASGWNFVAPDFVQTGVSNFFDNLNMPVVLLNDLLVLRVGDATEDFARALINTSVGVGGFVDVAGWMGVPENDADLGLTLGRWGVPPGPYLVVPFVGVYNVRDGVGAVGDSFARPHVWFVPFWASSALFGVNVVNQRAVYAEDIEEARAEALDYYVFVRNAYLQNRRSRVLGEEPSEEREASDEDLYWIEEDEP